MRHYTISSKKPQPWWPDSINLVSGKTGVVQNWFRVNESLRRGLILESLNIKR
jgi:hypothetical protein